MLRCTADTHRRTTRSDLFLFLLQGTFADGYTTRQIDGFPDTGGKRIGEPDDASMHPVRGDGRRPSHTALLDGGYRVFSVAARREPDNKKLPRGVSQMRTYSTKEKSTGLLTHDHLYADYAYAT